MIMKNEIRVFENEDFNVKVRINEKGEYEFDAETVAISLGITTVAKSGNVCVRWSRVNEYLEKYLPQIITKGGYIIEPLVYKLAFKASNEVAERFQDWLAYEVLPQLRQTGTYSMNTTCQCPLPPSAFESAANLGRLMERIMKLEGAAPHEIAVVLKTIFEQAGIHVPDCFIKLPAYEQLSFQETISRK